MSTSTMSTKYSSDNNDNLFGFQLKWAHGDSEGPDLPKVRLGKVSTRKNLQRSKMNKKGPAKHKMMAMEPYFFPLKIYRVPRVYETLNPGLEVGLRR